MMKTAIGYIRVSTEEQANSGISVESQREKLTAYCQMKNMNLVCIVTDAGVSGGKPLSLRPSGAKLMTPKADAVVTCKLDRLFRDAADCLNVTRAWDKRGTALHVLDMGGNAVDTSSPIGRMFLTMLAGFAEFERGLIRERTKVALRHKRRTGKLAGKVPFGYSVAPDGSSLVPIPEEQAALCMMKKMRADKKSLREIARWLQEHGVKTKHGLSNWRACSVRSVLNHAVDHIAA